MTNDEIKTILDKLLYLDTPSNYDSAEAACEAIADELDELSLEQHTDVCDLIEEWFHRGE